jgi:hypothetical protein
MGKQKKPPATSMADANSNVELLESGVKRRRMSWGFEYTGTRDVLLESRIVALAWLPDGIERNKKGQIKRTKITQRPYREIRCVQEARGRVVVWMPYTEEEEAREVAKYDAIEAERIAGFEELKRKAKLAAYKGADPAELKRMVMAGSSLLKTCVAYASGQIEKRDFGVVTACFPSGVLAKLTELALAWDSTVKNAEIIKLDHKRAHLSVVR